MKYLITFGLGTKYAKNCLIIETDNEDKARDYAFENYGQENVCSFYDYEEKKGIIEKYDYTILENIILGD